MDKLTISIFGNQIFSEIINEIKLFSKFKLKFYDNLDLCTKDAENYDQLVIFFITETNIKPATNKIIVNEHIDLGFTKITTLLISSAVWKGAIELTQTNISASECDLKKS